LGCGVEKIEYWEIKRLYLNNELLRQRGGGSSPVREC